MPKTQIKCPQCGQPILADIEQLFDTQTDPTAKSKLLSGAVNVIQCPHCGFHGAAATPIVYHDPEKERLLTYFPPELALPREEQEKIIGPLITKVFNSLPQEKRKGYLFNPVSMLTYKSLIEKILEADGITKEMLEAQEKRTLLLQRLLSASEESRENLIKAEDELIDREFFYYLTAIYETALMSKDQKAIDQLNKLQEQIIQHSTLGKKLQEESAALEKVAKALQKYGDEISRENILQGILNASDDAELAAYVKLARPGMDYLFFQKLSEKIDHASGDEQKRLIDIREKLLELTAEEDKLLQQRMEVANKNLETLLSLDDIESAVIQNQAVVDDYFIQALQVRMEEARKRGDLGEIEKLSKVIRVIEKLSTPPPEFVLINELLENSGDRSALVQKIEENKEKINETFLKLMDVLIKQTEEEANEIAGDKPEELMERKELAQRLKMVYEEAQKVIKQ